MYVQGKLPFTLQRKTNISDKQLNNRKIIQSGAIFLTNVLKMLTPYF